MSCRWVSIGLPLACALGSRNPWRVAGVRATMARWPCLRYSAVRTCSQLRQRRRPAAERLIGEPHSPVRVSSFDLEFLVDVDEMLLDRRLADHELICDRASRGRLSEHVAVEQRAAEGDQTGARSPQPLTTTPSASGICGVAAGWAPRSVLIQEKFPPCYSSPTAGCSSCWSQMQSNGRWTWAPGSGSPVRWRGARSRARSGMTCCPTVRIGRSARPPVDAADSLARAPATRHGVQATPFAWPSQADRSLATGPMPRCAGWRMLRAVECGSTRR